MRLKTKDLLILVASVAAILAAERFGEDRARRRLGPFPTRTIVVNGPGSEWATFTFDLAVPTQLASYRRMEARLRAEKAEYTVR